MHDPVEAVIASFIRDIFRCCLVVALVALVIGTGAGFLIAHLI
jgi:hypothetical protein